MRVLHFVSDFSNTSEIFIYDLIVDLEAMGLDNHVVTNRRVNQDSRPFNKVTSFEIDERGLMEKVIKRLRRKVIRDYRIFDQEKLEEVVRRVDPDVIHCHFNYFFENVDTLIQSGFKGRVVISTHGIDVVNSDLYRQPSYVDKVYRAQMHDNIVFTTPSNYLKGKLSEIYSVDEARVCVLPNSVNISMANFAEKSMDADGRVVLANVGRFVGFKGQSYLIEALKQLHQKGYDGARLKLIGFGVLEKTLREQAASLGIENAVEFHVDLSRERIFEELSSSDIYLQPSIKDEHTGQEESFGIAVLEALSVGLPVIVTDSGGLADTIRSAPYWPMTQIVRAKSSEALSQAVIDIVKSSHPPLKKAQIDELLSHFSAERNRQKVLEIYRGT